MIIYMATNRVNGKEYVGRTARGLKKRKQEHICCALKNEDNVYFHHAIKKYGPDNFCWEVLNECTNSDDLNILEIYYISLYNTSENGYNLTSGGNGVVGHKCSDETKQKIGNANRGRKPSEDTRKRMSESSTGKKHSTETRKRMSETRQGQNCGRKASKENRLKMSKFQKGKTISEEQRKKISAALKGKYTGKNNSRSRAVIINTKYFYAIVEASVFLGIACSTINYRIKNHIAGYSYAN